MLQQTWEQRKLGEDILSIHTGTNILGSETNDGIPLLKMGNLRNGYFDFSKLEYLPRNIDIDKQDIIKYGDFLFNTRNTLELVGKGATWTMESKKFAFNGNIARFDLKSDIDTIFFNYLYNTSIIMRQIHARATGTTSVAAIYTNTLNNLIYRLPIKDEQTKIGNFFQQLDSLITLHQRKLEHLKLKKKSLLQKLFPKEGEVYPELRFPGFTDPWEQRKFGDLFEYERPDAYTVKSDNYNNDFNMPVLTANKAFILGYTNEENSYNKPSIIFDDFTLDRKYVDFPYMLKSSAIKILTSKNQHNLRFLFERLNSTRFEVLGHARHYISVVQNTTTLCPSVDEEVCISNLLTKFDELITLHQRKLEHLQLLKKALLQQLFV